MVDLTGDVELQSFSRVEEEKLRSSYDEFIDSLNIYRSHPSIRGIRFVIFPDNPWIQRWDVLVLCMLLAVALIVPYQVGVSGGVHLLQHPVWFAVNVVINSVFFVDTFVYFFRAYRGQTGKLVFNPKGIRRRYLRTYFVPNILSIFPSTVIFYAIGTAYLQNPEKEGPRNAQAISLIKVLDLLKLIRFVRLPAMLSSSDVIRNVRETQKTFVLDLIKFTTLIIMVSHFFACIWAFVAFLEAKNLDEGLICNPNWIGNWLNSTYGNIYDCNTEEYKEEPPSSLLQPIGWNAGIDRYVLSLFWAIQTITSIGYGNISPFTRAEWWVGALLQLLAGIMWAYVIGGLVGVADLMKESTNIYRERIDQANDLVEHFVEPEENGEDDSPLDIEKKGLAKRIRRYVWNQKNTSPSECFASTLEKAFPVYGTLSPELKLRSSVMVLKPFLNAVPYLSSRYLSTDEQAWVALDCMLYEFSAGEMLKLEDHLDDVGRGIFVVKEGLAMARRFSFKTTKSAHLLTFGRSFGEDEVLLDDDLAGSKGTINFLTYTQVVFIPRKAILCSLEKNKKAWKGSARWKYAKALLLSRVDKKQS